MYSQSRYMLTKSLAEIREDEAPRVQTALGEIQLSLPVSLDSWTSDFVHTRSNFIAVKFVEALGVKELMRPLTAEELPED